MSEPEDNGRNPNPEPAADNRQPLAAPLCPNCNADPVMILARMFQAGPFLLLLAFCSACRHPIPAAVLDVTKPAIEIPKTRSPLII